MDTDTPTSLPTADFHPSRELSIRSATANASMPASASIARAVTASALGRALGAVLVRCAAILLLSDHAVLCLTARAVLLENRIGICRLHAGQ